VERKYAPHKKRLSEWSNPWLLAIGVALLLIGLPMVLWLMTYHSDAAVTMFIITWLSLTLFVLMMAKKSQLDPRYYVDRKVLDRTKREIETHRLAARKEMFTNEIATLRRGEKAPVLDVWRLDTSLTKRHTYFASTTSILIDPVQRELQVRIQLTEIGHSVGEKKSFCESMFNDVISYFGILGQDPYLLLLRRFFDTIVVQIDSLREDEHHMDTTYPILSVLAQSSDFWSMLLDPGFSRKRLLEIADVRFDDGNEIQPHRVIDLPLARGSK
jgi:hypothetical protein